MAVILDGYMKKKDFIIFIYLLVRKILKEETLKSWMLIMDNLASHHCTELKQLATVINTLYLPRYTPQLKLIEYLFSYHKQLVKRLIPNSSSKDHFDSLLINCLNVLGRNSFVSAELQMLERLIALLPESLQTQLSTLSS